MLLSESQGKFRFILDENVPNQLGNYLKSKYFDVKIAQKGLKDEEIAKISIAEKRILVTNDVDFSECTKEELFSLIWLRIPQNNHKILVERFSLLLEEKVNLQNFKGKLIILEQNRIKTTILSEKTAASDYRTLN